VWPGLAAARESYSQILAGQLIGAIELVVLVAIGLSAVLLAARGIRCLVRPGVHGQRRFRAVLLGVSVRSGALAVVADGVPPEC